MGFTVERWLRSCLGLTPVLPTGGSDIAPTSVFRLRQKAQLLHAQPLHRAADT